MAPLVPLAQLVVTSSLLMLMPPIHWCLCLLLHCHLLLQPSHASCPAGCCIASCDADASHPPVPPPHVALPPLVAPIMCLLFGWLVRLLTPPLTPPRGISDGRPSMPRQIGSCVSVATKFLEGASCQLVGVPHLALGWWDKCVILIVNPI
jgi:hypothetical protein